MNFSNHNSVRNFIQNDDFRKFAEIFVDFDSINRIVQEKCNLSVLHLCAKYNAKQILELILSSTTKICIDCRDFEGKTSLHVACIYESLDCIPILLNHGSDINALKRADWTPLMIAVSKCNLQIVDFLLKNGSDMRITNKDGWNVLHLATRSGNLELLQLLARYLEARDQTNVWKLKSKNGRTLMHIAAIHAHTGILPFLIMKMGFDMIQCKDLCGVSPFMDAARIDCVEICKLIRESSPFDLNDTDNLGRSSLHIAAEANAVHVIRYLIDECNCDKELLDKWQQTPIFLAVREGHLQATRLLIDLGAKLHVKDFKERTLLCIAKQHQHGKLIVFLDNLPFW